MGMVSERCLWRTCCLDMCTRESSTYHRILVVGYHLSLRGASGCLDAGLR